MHSFQPHSHMDSLWSPGYRKSQSSSILSRLLGRGDGTDPRVVLGPRTSELHVVGEIHLDAD